MFAGAEDGLGGFWKHLSRGAYGYSTVDLLLILIIQ